MMEEGGLDERVEDAEVADRKSSADDSREEKYESVKDRVYQSKDRRESLLNKLKAKSRKSNLESTVYDSKEASKTYKNDDSRETWEGAVAFIYNAEKGEFLIEEEYGKQAGKLRLIGGQKEVYDASTFETEAREIEEEVKEPAKHILLDYLRKNGTRYGSIINLINGGEVKSDIIDIHVSSPKDWEIVTRAQPMGGAGPFHIKTFDELWSMPDSSFAYDHGPIIKKFILEELVSNKNFLKHSGYTYNYSMPIITTNSIHLNTVDSFNNYTPSLN